MRSRRRFEWIFAALLFVTLSARAILAQDQDSAPPPANVPVQQNDSAQNAGPNAQQQDPPGRVARVQYMSGQVSMQPGGVNDWIAASTNRPLTTADRVWTDKDSRAELNVGDGFLRMSSETTLTLTNVGDNTVQLELDQGVLSVTVRHLQRGEVYEVDTPNLAFTLMKSGVYRFDVRPNEDQTWVTVRSGYGEATGQGPAVRVNSGMQVRFSGSNSLQHTAYSAPARDGFDDWVQVRDKRLDDSVSARYVSPGVIGYQDLDEYGHWTTAPTYGAVWVPNSVPVGWAPYRYGHWAWIAPWGWTWVDDAPWGFAPFHYGRWVSYGGGWGWAPGPIGYWNPYYSPALVGWIGGGGFGVGFGFGGGGWGIGINFGWFPLGWGEPFYPRYCGWGRGGWYGGGGYVSNGYLRNVNITNTNITNINNITNNYRSNNFANARYGFRNTAGAVTAAPRSAFASGAAINRVGGAVPKAELGRASLVRGADVNPTREAVLGGRSPLTHGVPPASTTNRSVVTRTPPPARPAGVEGNQSAMARANGGLSDNRSLSTTAHTPQPGLTTNQGAARTVSNSPASNNGFGRTNTAENSPGREVPRPPSAGGVATARPNPSLNTGVSTAPTHNVPRPPASNDSFARPNGNPTNAHGSANVAENHSPTINNPRYGTNTSQVPRPPQSYQPNRPASGAPQYSAPSHQSAPPQHATPQSNPRGSSHGSSSPSGPGAALSAPRPPAGYSYHAAPAQSASSAYGASRPTSSYSGNSRSTIPSYTSGRGSYGSAPSYSANRSYGANPAYSGRGYGSSPAYGSRSMSSYSAPRASSGGYHASSGGYGGGGGSHSSGSSGGGHHGR